MDIWKIGKAALYGALLAYILYLGKILFENLELIEQPLFSAFIAMDFGSMFVAACLVGALIFDRHYGNYNRVSAIVLSCIIVVISFDSLGMYSWKIAASSRMTFVYFNISYYLTSMTLFVMVLALKEFLSPSPGRYYRVVAVSFILMLADSVILIQNIFTENLWYMDGTEIVHNTLYPLMFVCPVLQDVLYVTACVYLARDKKVGLAYASFMVFSILGILFMYPHYYTTVNYLTTLFPMLLIIPYEYSRRGRELESGRQDLKMRSDALKASKINMHELDTTLMQLEHMNFVPDSVSEALGKFRKFIGENYESFNNPSMVPLNKELEYTNAYLYLEKLRFKKRLEIEYHINCTTFDVPSLSMQVLVENAVKHGIAPRPEGGKVIISVDAYRDYYMIVVEDNGVGFDVNAPQASERSHVGVGNISTRLRDMVGGQLVIESTPGHGTMATVIIPKNSNETPSSSN